MTLIPELEIGLCNAWLGVVSALLTAIIYMWVNREAGKRATDTSWYGKKEKRWLILTIFSYIAVILSFFTPLKTGTAWFYTGLSIYIPAWVLLIISSVNFASAPLDRPIVKGVYRISRNPLYFFTGICFLAAGIASASWLLIVLTVISHIGTHFIILGEERYCAKKYGQSYIDYKKRTPRYFLFF